MAIALYIAAALTVIVSAAHSYLGEKYILMRLFKRSDLPKIFGSADFTIRTLRFAWHLTSLAWLGFAVVFVLLANPAVRPQILCIAIGVIFLAHGALALGGSRGKHLSWVLFFAIGILALYAATIGE